MAKRLTERKKRRLIKEAREMLEPFGIDLSLYNDGEVLEGSGVHDSYLTGVAVEWARKDNGRIIIRSDNVIWHEDTGAVILAARPLLLDYT